VNSSSENSYPQHQWAVSSLFEGYGEEPNHSLRGQAVAVLNSPQSARSSNNEAPEVWIRRGTTELRLNDQALIAATRAFGHIRVNGLVFGSLDRVADHLLLEGDTPSWGLDEAMRTLQVS